MNYELNNYTSYDDNWLHKVIACCAPAHKFRMFITKDRALCEQLIDGRIPVNEKINTACVIPCTPPTIVLFLNPLSKYPYYSGKNYFYRKTVITKNEKQYLITTLAHEIRHLKNWYIPLKKYLKKHDYNWENPAIQKIYKKGELSSQEYELNFMKKIKQRQLV